MKEMGIPMGPRKKLMGYLRNQKQNMVGILERFDMELNHGVCTNGPSVNVIVCVTTVFVAFLKTKLNVAESIYYDGKYHYS